MSKLWISKAIVDIGATARATCRESAHVDVVLRMVEGVERFHTQGEEHALPDGKVLDEAQIPVVDAGLREEISTGIAVDADGGLSEATPC